MVVGGCRVGEGNPAAETEDRARGPALPIRAVVCGREGMEVWEGGLSW